MEFNNNKGTIKFYYQPPNAIVFSPRLSTQQSSFNVVNPQNIQTTSNTQPPNHTPTQDSSFQGISRGFVKAQKLDGKTAKILSEIKSIRAQLNNMKNLICKYKLKYNQLKKCLLKKEQQLNKCNNNDVLEQYEFLRKHLNSIKNGSFDKENRHIFLIFSQMGESLWTEFVRYMGFPSWRTIQRWRNEELIKSGINQCLFNGQTENIVKIFKIFFGDNFNDSKQRFVIAIDAAGITPRVVIHANGQIEGFMEDIFIDPEEAKQIKSSIETLKAFIDVNKNEIIKDFFVIYVCPLKPSKGGFPLVIYPKNNGAADVDCVGHLEEIYLILRSLNINVIGLAFDGDTGYLKFAKAYYTKFSEFVFSSHAKKLYDLIPYPLDIPLIFEDMYHVIKCIRYRFVCGSNICIYPFRDTTINIQDLTSIGISDWILDPSQSKKMDDLLPLMIFNLDNIVKAANLGKFEIAIALLPSTLLAEAVLNQDLTRSERLQFLSYSWSFFYVYRYYIKKSPNQNPKKMKGKNNSMCPYDSNTLDKVLSLIYSLCCILKDPRSVHMGSLGTHWLEHFFGNIRRLCVRDDSPPAFIRSTLYLVLRHVVSNQPINGRIKKRSDSGAILKKMESNEILNCQPIGKYLHDVMQILKIENEKYEKLSFVNAYTAENFFASEFFSTIVEKRKEKKYSSIKQARITCSSGYGTIKRFVEESQV